jgi:hypothetical protein
MEFILATNIYKEHGLDIIIVDSLSKYEYLIGIIELFIFVLLFINYISAIIFSINWLKKNK